MNLSNLPPTEDAATQHLYRVYLQVQKWLSNDLLPTEWGWSKENNLLRPIRMKNQAAPDDILKMIFCSCKKICGKGCSCKKAGLNCSPACGYCEEKNCSNLPTPNLDPEEEANEEANQGTMEDEEEIENE